MIEFIQQNTAICYAMGVIILMAFCWLMENF